MFVAIYAKHVVKTFPFHGRIQRRPGIWSKELKTHAHTHNLKMNGMWQQFVETDALLKRICFSFCFYRMVSSPWKLCFCSSSVSTWEGIYNMYVLQKELSDMDWNWMVKWQQRNSITIFVTVEWLNMGEKKEKKTPEITRRNIFVLNYKIG